MAHSLVFVLAIIFEKGTESLSLPLNVRFFLVFVRQFFWASTTKKLAYWSVSDDWPSLISVWKISWSSARTSYWRRKGISKSKYVEKNKYLEKNKLFKWNRYYKSQTSISKSEQASRIFNKVFAASGAPLKFCFCFKKIFCQNTTSFFHNLSFDMLRTK